MRLREWAMIGIAFILLFLGILGCNLFLRDRFAADCASHGGQIADIHGGKGGYICIAPDGGIIPL